MSGTMGRMYIGASGLQASQNAINTTAHNLTNLDTEGYSRQQVIQSDLGYQKLGFTKVSIKQTGLGTKVSQTRTTRDIFLDNKYRTQNARKEFYNTKAGIIDEVGEFFGETEGNTFETYLKNMWNSIQELQKTPNGYTQRTALVSTASAFIDRATEIHDQLVDYQKNLNETIQDQVDRINELSQTIMNINDKILKLESSGVEAANDYRDARNQALDELSGLISIEIKEQSNGTVNVYAEQHSLVSEDRTFVIGTVPVEPGSDLLTVFWENDTVVRPDGTVDYSTAKVFNLERPMVAGDNLDTGSLKGLLSARGDYTPNYTDIPFRRDHMDLTDSEYQQLLTDYNRTLNNRDVANLISQFDNLIHGIVTKMNDILCPNTEITVTNGNTYTILDTANAGRGFGAGNEAQGTELFTRKGYDRYTYDGTIQYVDENGDLQTGAWIFNPEDANDYYSLYTTGQVEVNDALLQNPALLPLTTTDDEEYQEVANQLIDMWNEDFSTLDPNSLVMNTYNNYYAALVGDYADRGHTYTNIGLTQETLVGEVDNQRQEVLGVSSDDELTNLIKYQHAYNANSRYITVVSEMIEHLIERLGS
ncbi:MAG: flagellar hook-associated protein FlgK [Lachnospiraceae bacterium]|nr:flagellar hook-associated protein FlgK [Lachnospiraceae bacterium]